jgi:rhodanese-related sulfurtransferase
MLWRRKKTKVIKPAELAAEINEGRDPIIVDVRSGKDFQTAHLPGAINIPFEELEQRKNELDATKPTVFY